MRPNKSTYPALVALALTATADAGPVQTGEDLLAYCDSRTTPDQAVCQTYVQAAFEAADAFHPDGLGVCLPAEVTYQQLVDTVTEYLRKTPAQRALPAYLGTVNALLAAWPCQ